MRKPSKVVVMVLAGMVLALLAHQSGAADMEDITLENESLRVILDGDTGAFVSAYNKASGLELISSPERGIVPWELRLGVRDEKGERIETVAGAKSFGFSEDEDFGKGEAYELTWEVEEGMSVAVRAELEDGRSGLRLYPAVLSTATDSMIVKLRYPIVRGIGRLSPRGEENFLAHPWGSGFLFKDPYSLLSSGERMPRGKYPNGFQAPVQFMVYYADATGGFYFGCEDPYGTVKDVDFYSPVEKEYLEAAFGHYSWDMHLGNNLRLGYPVVIAALEGGNWEEGAELYRKWATTVGPGHPDWCDKGRLEERVERGEASKWLAEEVGFCTFGMPSSIDVSRWIEAFHEAAGGSVFHVFGHDWPKWAGNPVKRGRIQLALRELGLGWIQQISRQAIEESLRAGQGLSDEKAAAKFVEALAEKVGKELEEGYSMEAARVLYDEAPGYLDRTRSKPGRPMEWFPSIMNARNIEALKRLGDHYALFEFDFFPYGYDLGRYGLNTWGEGPLAFNPRKGGGFARNWMDPGTKLWVDFHAERDARASREVGADAHYYDISAAAVGESVFSNRTDRLQRPMGWGRKLVEEYRDLYEGTKMATSAVTGGYVPQGSEVMAEVFMREMDYAQCRAGGGVQGDMEGIRFLDWMKEGLCWRIPLFTYVYHEYGTIKLDGWAKLSREFGEIFYYIAAQVALEGGILELNYEFSPLELFPGMSPPSYQLHYHCWVRAEDNPLEADKDKVKFLREITRARTVFAKKYLAYGAMIKPAEVVEPLTMARLDWKHYNSIVGRREAGEFEAAGIVHQGWNYRGERLGYVFCNILPESQRAEVIIDLKGTPLEGKRVKVFQVGTRDRDLLGSIDTGRRAFSVELPARKIVLLEVIPTRWR